MTDPRQGLQRRYDMEEILELTQAAEFIKTMGPMFRQIAKCINSSHFQVSVKRYPTPYHPHPLLLYSGSHCSHFLVFTENSTEVQWLINVSPTQVGERALFLWNNDYIVSLVAQNRHLVLPIVFGALERNARTHWNAAVHGKTMLLTPLHRPCLDWPLAWWC